MSDISKLIDESIASVINEDDITNSPATRFFKKLVTKKVVAKSAEKNAANPELSSASRHSAKRAAELNAEMAKQSADDAQERSLNPNEGLLAKGLRKGKEYLHKGAEEIDEKIKEHPYLAATTAAALAAGLGGLAAVKKMRKAAVKGKKK